MGETPFLPCIDLSEVAVRCNSQYVLKKVLTVLEIEVRIRVRVRVNPNPNPNPNPCLENERIKGRSLLFSDRIY